MFDGKERFINLLVRSRNLVFCFGGFFRFFFPSLLHHVHELGKQFLFTFFLDGE